MKSLEKLIIDAQIITEPEAESLTERLTNEVFTERTASVQKKNFFANREKKD